MKTRASSDLHAALGLVSAVVLVTAILAAGLFFANAQDGKRLRSYDSTISSHTWDGR